MRSSAAASTTGSTTRRPSARPRSCVPACPACRRRSRRACHAVALLRERELYKLPGVGETITWARALLALDGDGTLDDTLGVALKVREDIDRVRREKVLEGA